MPPERLQAVELKSEHQNPSVSGFAGRLGRLQKNFAIIDEREYS